MLRTRLLCTACLAILVGIGAVGCRQQGQAPDGVAAPGQKGDAGVIGPPAAPGELPLGATARLGRLMRGESVLAFSADGSLIATAHSPSSGKGDKIRVWEVASGKQVATLKGHPDLLGGAFSPDASVFVSTGIDNTVCAWNMKTGELLGTAPLDSHGYQIAFLPAGDRFFSASADVVLWGVPPKREKAVTLPLPFEQGGFHIALSRDGKRLVTFGGRGVHLWDATERKVIRALYDDHPFAQYHAFGFAPDDKVLVDYHWHTGEIRRWTPTTGERLAGDPVNLPAQLLKPQFSPDVRLLAAPLEGPDKRWDLVDIVIHDVITGKEVSRIRNLDMRVQSFLFSPDSKNLAVSGSDGSLHLWNVADGKFVQTFVERSLPILALHYAAEGKTLVSLTADPALTLHHWDVHEHKQRRRVKLRVPADGHALRTSPDGQFLATVDRKGLIRVSNAVTDKLLWQGDKPLDNRGRNWSLLKDKTKEEVEELPPVFRLVDFSSDGRTVAGLTKDGRVAIWESATGKQLHQVAAPAEPLHCLALGPSGKRFAVAIAGVSHDQGLAQGKILILDPASGKKLATLNTPKRAPGERVFTSSEASTMVFSPDGTQLAVVETITSHFGGKGGVGQHREIRLWDLGAQPKDRLMPMPTFGDPVFSPDSGMLAFGWSGGVAVWDVRLGKLGFNDSRVGHDVDVDRLTFSPDGKSLATSGRHQTILVWDVAELFRRPPGERPVNGRKD